MVDGAEAEVDDSSFDLEHGTVGELVAAITGQPGGHPDRPPVPLGRHPAVGGGSPLRGPCSVSATRPRTPPAAVDGVVELRTVGGLSAGCTVRLPSGEHVIGRLRCRRRTRLDHELRSPRRPRQTPADGTASISDLGSRNGTAVESYLLPGRCILEDGQVIQVG